MKSQSSSFHKKIILVSLILLFPIFIFILFLYKEVIFGIFLIPVFFLTLLPCGIISFILAKHVYKDAIQEKSHTVEMIGIFQMLLGFLMSIGGLLAILLMIALVI